MHEYEYRRPESLRELWDLFGQVHGEVGLLAGGTDLVPALKRGLATPTILADIKQLPELQGIVPTEGGGVRVGATVTLHALARSPEMTSTYPVLAEAAGTVASYQVRNRGTVGGNVCLDTRCAYFNQNPFWRAEYPDCRKTGGSSCYVAPGMDGCHALSSSDLAPLLIALSAQVETASPKEMRVRPAEDLFSGTGLRSHSLERDEVLTAVLLPPATGVRAAYRRFATRETVGFPMLSVAGCATANGQARLVVGHVTSRPQRIHEAERGLTALLGGEGGDRASIGEAAVAELELVSSVRGSVAYKRHVLRALVVETAADLHAAEKRGG